ncbi:MAG: bacillithiol biosynthesis cysteine-adding enzyme BshC [Bacteroidota bacterium]
MPTDGISYQESGYFTNLILDYLNEEPVLHSFYNRFPTLENFEKQIFEKKLNYNGKANREILVAVLQKQYEGIQISSLTQQHIGSLSLSNTFTVTTGHQLNLFTGPLYFLYKIISTINLTKELKTKYPSFNFVPLYWMATEDHDFEEINYFNFKGKKIRWNADNSGPVGRKSTTGLDRIFKIFESELGLGKNADVIKKLFQDAYLNHKNLADATRYLANSLFGEQGLVILDADNKDLKQEFIPYIKKELLDQNANQFVLETTKKLTDYTIQVNPRAINLFYIENEIRERILFENGIYKVNNTAITFTESEILDLVDNSPEKFSPNVIMRPLYQEVILPNLCYIGGGGEIAYWLQLKAYFDNSNITFPILLIRNSVLLVTEKQAKKASKLDLTWKDLFSSKQVLENREVKKLTEFPIDFSIQKAFLQKHFEDLQQIALQTDPSFIGAVNAQEKKQLKGLENLEKRLLVAQKRKHQEALNRIGDLQNELFPNGNLQERIVNFSEFYIENGIGFLGTLFETLQPLEKNFNIIIL